MSGNAFLPVDVGIDRNICLAGPLGGRTVFKVE
jgi:hypothetical protein